MIIKRKEVSGSVKSKMVALKTYVHVSACIHDTKEILTPIPVYSGSSNTTGLRYTLSDVIIKGKWD
jgi:hypothetical protein